MDPMNWLWIKVVKTYLRIYSFFARRFGIHLRGLGFALRTIKRPFVFRTGDRWFYFDPAQAGAYITLMVDPYPEIETHLFLHRVLESHPGPLTFVDVGASIGEIVIDIAGYPQVTRVVAFEPQATAAAAIRRSVELNGFKQTTVVQKLVGKTQAQLEFTQSPCSPAASHIAEASEQGTGILLPCTTLDDELGSLQGPVAMVIDVEGAEFKVIQGGREFVRRLRPLIVFEYQEPQRGKFSLDEFQEMLGPGYSIYRLRGDGWLDRRFESTWNCVALADDSPLYEACRSSFHCDMAGTERPAVTTQ